MKSETTDVGSLVKVYGGIFKDATLAFPSRADSLIKDSQRLRDQIERHGVKVSTLWLPALDTHFIQCLDCGEYSPSHLPLGRCSGRRRIPLFLNGLFQLVFDTCSGRLLDDASPDAIAFIRQFYLFGKKLEVKVDEGTIHETIAKFAATDLGLPSHESVDDSYRCTDCLPSDISLLQVLNLGHERECSSGQSGSRERNYAVVCQAVFDRVASCFPLYDWSDIRPQHGPGAVSDLRKTRVSKYDMKWNSNLEIMFPVAEFMSVWDGEEIHHPNIEPGSSFSSRLCAVPKTAKGPRLIACEPAANQFMQQAIKRLLYEGIAQSWIFKFLNLRDQTTNQTLALRASKTCRLATVDLSEASDRVSQWAVACLFRKHTQLSEMLTACRTPLVDFSSFGGVADYRVRKYASMGNATTFPVESLIFLSLALTAQILRSFADSDMYTDCISSQDVHKRFRRIMHQSVGQVSVFGDDIIIPKDSLGYLEDLFNLFGFKINKDKTFSREPSSTSAKGGFRESCGVDAFRGYIVTPVKPKVLFDASKANKPRDVVDADKLASLVALSNNLYKQGYWHAANVVASFLPAFAKSVDNDNPLGLFTYTRSRTARKIRWNKDLCRREIRSYAITTKGQRRRAEFEESNLIQLCIEQPLDIDDWSGGFDARPVTKVTQTWKAG